ncbi:hypothetical protein EH223_11430 [candidate division KSB1 bacterium]|nr:MAG: hypothetical protein EH223_11430 [candidate division KSB1 bacterium]
MQTMVLKKKVSSTGQITINLPQVSEGEEVALIVVFNSREQVKKSGKRIFNLEQWANRWETDLGEDVKSTDVESFTGRRY